MQLNEAKPNRSLKERVLGIENLGVLVIMVVFIAIVLVVAGGKFFNPTNITNLLRSVSVTGIMACAVTFVMITGNIDLSIGWLIGFCAVLTGVHSASTSMVLLLALLAGLAGGALNGLLVGYLKLNPFITTLGTMYVFNGITMIYSNGKLLTAADNPTLKFIGQGTLLGIPVPVWLFAGVALVLWFVLRKTTFGTRVYAVGTNPHAAKFSGISSGRIVLIAYMLSGLATGLAGVVFYAKVMSVQPYSGVGMEFDVLTAVVLGGTSVSGGKGNVLGTLLGVVFVGILTNGFTLMGLGSNAQYITQGLILLVAMRTDVLKTGGRT